MMSLGCLTRNHALIPAWARAVPSPAQTDSRLLVKIRVTESLSQAAMARRPVALQRPNVTTSDLPPSESMQQRN
jgi:hypothetical protein